MKWCGREFDLREPAVMAIVNVTPDSFFAGSRVVERKALEERVRRAVSEGAAIIDIGGCSTRPGAAEISEREERNRVLLGLDVVDSVAPEVAVSVDTYRAGVAASALQRRADCMINDITAGEYDAEIVDVAAEYGVPYVAMHMRGMPSDMAKCTDYRDVVAEVADYLAERAEFVRSRGVESVVLDAGFGFAKTLVQNYELLGGLERIVALGYPVLAGLSRKSMIYKTLESSPEEALFGTVALNWECLMKGAALLRVHDVRAAVDVVKIFNKYRDYGVRF